ncbi:MAG: RHS repeat-associated core domain-containing protein [Akkermansiaceae bacterium]|nr:RHS repeat-associated core domain-containing protein [Akkermansiaceae bacterium]
MIADEATTIPAGVDSYVNKIEQGWNNRGLLVRTTSKAGSTVRNEIAWDYNDFNQPVTEYQEHGGAVSTSTSLKVTYGYESGASNTIRRKSMKYPHSGSGSAKTLQLDYISEQAKAISRFDELGVDSTKETTFKYVGLDMPFEQKLPNASDVFLTLGDSSDHYAGYDRFGRLVGTQWKDGTSHLVHSTYGRNRHGGVVWRRDEKAHDLSVDTQDTYYKYDGLQQVTSHQRGDLVTGTTPPFTGIDSGTREQSETFSYDQMGNWLGYTSQSPSLTQTRTHNKDNEIASLTNPSGIVQPTYDAAGNMTEMPSPDDWTNAYTCTWDAWNRLVEIKDGATTVATYRYDGQTRRITKALASETRSYYFNDQWRALEERVSGTVDKDYLWNPADRWNLIQYRFSNSTALDSTRYVLKDGLDPVAVIDSSGAVQERAFYEAFGPITFMDANFGDDSSSSVEEWTFLFHGEFIDTETNLYNYGFRYYHPELGRWTSRDPIGEKGGINLYGMVGNDAIGSVDELGLQKVEFARLFGAGKIRCRPTGAELPRMVLRRAVVFNCTENKVKKTYTHTTSVSISLGGGGEAGAGGNKVTFSMTATTGHTEGETEEIELGCCEAAQYEYYFDGKCEYSWDWIYPADFRGPYEGIPVYNLRAHPATSSLIPMI